MGYRNQVCLVTYKELEPLFIQACIECKSKLHECADEILEASYDVRMGYWVGNQIFYRWDGINSYEMEDILSSFRTWIEWWYGNLRQLDITFPEIFPLSDIAEDCYKYIRIGEDMEDSPEIEGVLDDAFDVYVRRELCWTYPEKSRKELV